MPDLDSELAALRIEREPERHRGGRGFVWAVLVIVLAAAGFGAWRWFSREQPLEVETAVVSARQAGTQAAVLNASGYVTARRRATVSSKIWADAWMLQGVYRRGNTYQSVLAALRGDPDDVHRGGDTGPRDRHVARARFRHELGARLGARRVARPWCDWRCNWRRGRLRGVQRLPDIDHEPADVQSGRVCLPGHARTAGHRSCLRAGDGLRWRPAAGDSSRAATGSDRAPSDPTPASHQREFAGAAAFTFGGIGNTRYGSFVSHAFTSMSRSVRPPCLRTMRPGVLISVSTSARSA